VRNPLGRLSNNAGPAQKGAACSVTLTPEQAENRGLAWLIGAFLICPCHLPLTLGLAAILLSGTAAGVLLRDHLFLAGAVITVAWVAGTWRGISFLRSASKYARAQLERDGR